MPHQARLRKVGGSVMLAIPKPVVEALDLSPDSAVDLSIRAGKLIIDPHQRRRRSLDELLARCKRPARRTRDEHAWTAGKAVGRELI